MSGFRHWKRAVLAALAAPGGVAGIGAAQEEAPGLPPPPVRGEPVVVRPVQAPTVRPVQPGQPSAREAVAGLEGRDLATPPAQMLRDGAFLSAERGVPLASPAGEWLVAFQHPDLPPMVLLPSRALERLIEEVEGREGAVAVRL